MYGRSEKSFLPITDESNYNTGTFRFTPSEPWNSVNRNLSTSKMGSQTTEVKKKSHYFAK